MSRVCINSFTKSGCSTWTAEQNEVMPEMRHIQGLCQGWLSPGGCDERSGRRSLLSSVRDGKKHLPASQKEARAVLNEAAASSTPISTRCSVTVNHCCAQVSKRTEEQQDREQGVREGKWEILSCSGHETRAKSSTAPQKQKPRKTLPRLKARLGSAPPAGGQACTSQTKGGR